MKIPKDMTEESVLAVIDKVLKRYIKRFAFGIHSKDDLYQEGFIMSLSALEAYDGSSPLENFLAVHLRQRFIDFKRNNSGRPNDHCNECKEFNESCDGCIKRRATYNARRNLNRPIDIDNVRPDGERSLLSSTDCPSMMLEHEELLRLINLYLPISYRENYLKMREGVYVPKPIRDEIELLILDILEEHG